ncbi:MAG: NAD(P)H-quinone dehydrogenase [Austwickia sp.]|nr:NAD(P)H-quinone dehydrogenase [Austwickia sp.]
MTSTHEQSRIVVIGGGPGGYEAAQVAARLGAHVTVVERAGLGGSAVLTDVVPSKTLIATSDVMAMLTDIDDVGLRFPQPGSVDLSTVNARVRSLASAQSQDIRRRLERDGVAIVEGSGRLLSRAHVPERGGPERNVPGDWRHHRVEVTDAAGARQELPADTVLVAVGARPRTLAQALPDGERILTWTQLYQLRSLPERLIVVGSGVTGAEFASAYDALGADVVLVSSRDRVLPGEDADAADLIEAVFRRRGMTVISRVRAMAATRTGDGVSVELDDGRVVEGSHALIAVGSIPNTEGLGLTETGVRLTDAGHARVDRVSRTSAPGIYAAGDCTGVLPLASVAAMQGRIAMWHALGQAVHPLDLATVSATIFTAPEIATVGVSEQDLATDPPGGRKVTLPLAGNPRAKMQGLTDGFVKVFSNPSGVVIGGVVVAQHASELILPLTLAVQHRLTVEQLATTFTVYPSLAGSLTEAARRLQAP